MKKIRLSEMVMNAIKEMIADEQFAPGDRFYSEHELARKLDVSRSSIREAIRILEITGQLTVRQGKGIFIADQVAQELEPFARWLKSNESALMDHFEVRMIIDPKAAAYAAGKAGEEDIIALQEAWEDFNIKARENDMEGLIKADRNFHRLLARSTGNRTLFVLMKTMVITLNEGWISSLHTPGRVNKTTAEHKLILDAVIARDPARAEEAMRVHIQNAIDDISSLIKDQD